MIEQSRRGFIGSLIAFTVVAPAIVRATSIMPVKAMPTLADLEAELNRELDLYNPGELYAELQAVTRKAFVPRLYVELSRSNFSLAQLWDKRVSA
jgi:hypothetical protein